MADSSDGAAAAVVLSFVNTHDHRGRLPDRFSERAGVEEWLASQGQQSGVEPAEVTPADAAEAREIRDALIAILLTHADPDAVSDDDLIGAERGLKRAAQRYPLQANITRAGAGLTMTQSGLAGMVASVLAAVIELSQSRAWDRVKACRNCHHGFVDQSRNASAGFCRANCKSQSGMRSYRSRQRDIKGH